MTTETLSIVSLCVLAVSGLWVWWKETDIRYYKQSLKEREDLVASLKESCLKEVTGLKEQLLYQQTLIDTYKKDVSDVQEKYFALATAIQPTLAHTDKTLLSLNTIIQQLITNGKRAV